MYSFLSLSSVSLSSSRALEPGTRTGLQPVDSVKRSSPSPPASPPLSQPHALPHGAVHQVPCSSPAHASAAFAHPCRTATRSRTSISSRRHRKRCACRMESWKLQQHSTRPFQCFAKVNLSNTTGDKSILIEDGDLLRIQTYTPMTVSLLTTLDNCTESNSASSVTPR